MKNLIISLVVASFLLSGCGFKEYYNANKEQNIAIHQMNLEQKDKEREADRKHEEKMVLLASSALIAAAKTENKIDDVLVPMMIMNIEDKRIMAKALTAQKTSTIPFKDVKAPDTFGDGVKKSTGAILGLGGLYVGVTQSNNLKDVAVAGLNSAGTAVNGDNNVVLQEGNTFTKDITQADGSSINSSPDASSTNTDDHSDQSNHDTDTNL